MSEDGPERRLRVAVIGGGITGLAAAHRLAELARHHNRPLQLTQYEASQCVGGVFGTRRVGEYRIETGADSFITDKPWALDLCQRLGLENQFVPVDERYRRALILHKGRPVATPDGFQLMAPSRLGPFFRTPLLSLRGKIRVASERFLPPNPPAGDESLGSFVRRRFGQEALERIVQPMVGGIYTAHLDKLSLSATLPRFQDMERNDGSVIRGLLRRRKAAPGGASGARYGMFVSLRDGMSELQTALLNRIESFGEVRIATPVSRISPSNPSAGSGFRIDFESETPEEVDAVIACLPAYRAAGLVEAWNSQLALALREIEYASSAIVVSGHRRDQIAHPLDAAGLVVPAIENRRILAVSFLSRKFPNRAPDGCVILRTFVGGATQPELYAYSDDELEQLVHEELQDTLGTSGEPEFMHVVRWERAMPQYHVGHLGRISHIEQLCEPHTGFALAGSAYRGVGIPDCIHDGEQAAERIWFQLSGSNAAG